MALHAMDTAKLYLTLGFSSIIQYAESFFLCKRSQTYEFLAVAEALHDLPLCDNAYQAGGLSWSILRELAKVATNETEAEWLEFVRSHSHNQIIAEIKDAKRKKRNHPRRDSYSLPDLSVQVNFEFSPEEHDIIRKAMEKTADEMGEGVNGQKVEPKDTLLYMARRILETDPAGARRERDDSIYTILYHRCPECSAAHLPTQEGPVEIPREAVERVESEAKKVVVSGEVPVKERDKPNTAATARKIRLRDGRVCSNPMCGRRLGLHAHHIQFRSDGGSTMLGNEILVCTVCHSLIHQGLLALEGNPVTGLSWRPKSEGMELNLDEEFQESSSVSEVRVVEKSTTVDSGRGNGKDFSTTVDSNRCNGRDLSTTVENAEAPFAIDEDLVSGLRNIGYPEREARDRISKATRELSHGSRKPKEEEILLSAVQT